MDAPGEYPVIVVDYESGEPTTHTEFGQFTIDGRENPSDLIEVREPLECWVRVQDDGTVDYGSRVTIAKIEGARRLFREVIE